MSRTSTFTIFESSLDGHRGRYVRYIAEYLVSNGIRPRLVLSKNAALAPEYIGQIVPLLEVVDVKFLIPSHPSYGFLNIWIRWRALAKAMNLYGPSNFILPTADHLAQGLIFSWPLFFKASVRDSTVTCIMLRLRSDLDRKDLRSRSFGGLNRLLLGFSPWQRFWTIDPRVQGRFGLSSIRYVPDPIEKVIHLPQVDARKRLGLPVDGLFFGAVGRLSERKGIDILLRAFVLVAPRTSAILVLAGEATEGVRQLIETVRMDPNLAERIIWRPGFLSESELDEWICSVDVVCLPYVGHMGISSFLLRSVALRRWVLGSNEGWIGRTIRDRQIGLCADVMSLARLGDAMCEILPRVKSTERLYPSTSWLSRHTPSNFASEIVGDLITRSSCSK